MMKYEQQPLLDVNGFCMPVKTLCRDFVHLPLFVNDNKRHFLQQNIKNVSVHCQKRATIDQVQHKLNHFSYLMAIAIYRHIFLLNSEIVNTI